MDTAINQVDLDNIFDELNSVEVEFVAALDSQRELLGLEALDVSELTLTELNTTSLEEVREGYAPTSSTNAYRTVARGLTEKTKNGVKGAVRKAPKVLLDSAKSGAVGLGKLANLFVEKLTNFVNKISTATSKLLLTLYPLMGNIINDAESINDSLTAKKQSSESGINVSGSGKYLSLDGAVANPETVIKQLLFIKDIQDILLSEDKLKAFTEFSSAVIEPFNDTIKTNKIDPYIVAMAILGTVTNPGVPVGMFLKKIASAANPAAGEVLDKSAKFVGGAMTAGLGGFVAAVGTSAGPIIKELENGRLDISVIPKFKKLYPFCTNEVRVDGGLYVQHTSNNLLGNMQWLLTDYNEELTAEMKGSVMRVGATFDTVAKSMRSKDSELKPLREDQVKKICDLIVVIMKNSQLYCKAWPEYSKTYLEQYQKISAIVMKYDPDEGLEDGRKSVVGRYVRYSYRNSMNIMLGSVWKNCFGSDNKFIRYMVKLSQFLLKYCNASLVSSDERKETDSVSKQTDSDI